MEMAEQDTSYWSRALRERIRARAEMKKFEEAEADLRLLETKGGRGGKRQAERLRKRYFSGDRFHDGDTECRTM